jgi:hypothetical protein
MKRDRQWGFDAFFLDAVIFGLVLDWVDALEVRVWNWDLRWLVGRMFVGNRTAIGQCLVEGSGE